MYTKTEFYFKYKNNEKIGKINITISCSTNRKYCVISYNATECWTIVFYIIKMTAKEVVTSFT